MPPQKLGGFEATRMIWIDPEALAVSDRTQEIVWRILIWQELSSYYGAVYVHGGS